MAINDEAEQRANDYLRHLGFTDIESQPEGKGKFPDFRVENRIGVEVRRLNMNAVDGRGKLTSEDQGALSVGKRVRDLLATLGPPLAGTSWYVRSHFNRPFIKWRKLAQALEKKLLAFQTDPQDKAIIEVAPNFSVELFRASNQHAHCFIDGAYDDLDNHGYVVEFERQRNLNLCIREKTLKRGNAQLTRTYSEWWLFFDDHIGFGLPFDFPEQMRIETGDWDRIILLNPRDPKDAYQVSDLRRPSGHTRNARAPL